MNHYKIFSLPLIVSLLASLTIVSPSKSFTQTADSSISVQIITDEADAVLSILAKRERALPLETSDWQRLYSSEGYRRLKKREGSMQRKFTDDDFKSFVMSDTLMLRTQKLKETLDKWKQTDMKVAAGKALAYLPEGTRIRAKIYPVIKPRTNSFVFEMSTDPAIFLFINPEVSREKFENTLAHELHHIGLDGAPRLYDASKDTTISKEAQTVLNWAGAFGEGAAMLAAAGSPDVHPHAVSLPDERAQWDHDMRNYASDLKMVEKFFLDILDHHLSPDSIRSTGFSFFGLQGPWYTVGWKMGSTIEKAFGRPKLIECICNPALLLSTYNKAALLQPHTDSEPLVLWDTSLLDRLATK